MARAEMQTSHLENWSDIEGDTEWSTLLIGNGASINLWQEFEYKRLFDRAEIRASPELFLNTSRLPILRWFWRQCIMPD